MFNLKYISSLASNDYNTVCTLFRKLHPELKGNEVDKKVKELFWDPFKQGKLDLQQAIKDLKEKVEIQK